MNGRFPIALHIMTLLCDAEGIISSDYIAGSINVNAVLIRKELSNLIKHRLGQPAKQITLAVIYKAVKPEAILGKAKNQPNPACPVGKQINEHLHHLEKDIEQAMIDKLCDTNLADFCSKFS
jgi:DNA-binding IscR family transcriptional regulator